MPTFVSRPRAKKSLPSVPTNTTGATSAARPTSPKPPWTYSKESLARNNLPHKCTKCLCSNVNATWVERAKYVLRNPASARLDLLPPFSNFFENYRVSLPAKASAYETIRQHRMLMLLVKQNFRKREKPCRESVVKGIVQLLLRNPFAVIDSPFHEFLRIIFVNLLLLGLRVNKDNVLLCLCETLVEPMDKGTRIVARFKINPL